ncbi:MAG: type II secretion system protein [Gammaproteobacteria bacterium]
MKHYNNMARQAGMTLIELTVVLLVLIGLAGLLIPYVSGFVSKTHDSTGTFNSAGLDNNIQRYIAEKMRAPNNMESLISSTAGADAAGQCSAASAAIDTVYCKLMAPGFFATTALNNMEVMSLSGAGITAVYNMDNQTTNATFGSTGANVSTPLAAATPVATVAALAVGGAAPNNFPEALSIEEHLAAAFERPVTNFDSACYDYVAFGIGDKTDMIGSTMSTAPVHFASQGAMGPANRYNRFVAIFQVDKADDTVANAPGGGATTGQCSANVEPAKFIGAAMTMAAMSGHLWGTSHSLAHSWENIAAN